MTVKLIDLIKLMKYNATRVQVFDSEDNLIFYGTRNALLKALYEQQTLAVREVSGFQEIRAMMVIDVK